MTKELQRAIESDAVLAAIWPRVGLAGYVGSLAHGTAGDVIDDIDLYGAFVAPPAHYYGLTQLDHVVRVGVVDRYDFALYELRKFIRLLLKGNPNVLSLLWLPQNLYVMRDGWGQRLLDNRDLFMSKMLYKTFGGYAHAQLQKMTRGCTTQAYRGAKRRERFQRFGYDCKNAAHLIRLLRMGIEALATGEINVSRHDAVQLKVIKSGGWTLAEVKREAERLNRLLDEAFVKSELPAKPDRQTAENLLIEILSSGLTTQ